MGGTPSRRPPFAGGIWPSDHRLDSLAFIIPFLNPFCFCFYAVRHVSGLHRRAPMLMLVVSLKLSAACCFRVCVQLCDLTTCIHLRPCTIASAPKFSVASLFLERRFFHGHRHSRLNVEPSSRLQLVPCWALPERSGCVASTNPNVHPSGAYHSLRIFYYSMSSESISATFRRRHQLFIVGKLSCSKRVHLRCGVRNPVFTPPNSRVRGFDVLRPTSTACNFTLSLFLGPS